MDLEFTSDQNDLRASVRAVLSRECPTSLVRRVVETGEPADDLHRTMAELDWFGLSVPEPAGGLGLGFAEVGVVVEELGRVIAPGPYLATMTQFVPVVTAAGSPEQHEALLGPVATGSAAGALALADHPRRWELTGVTATATPLNGSRWELSGTKRAVLASPGDLLAVVARTGAGDDPALGVFVVEGGQVKSDPVRALDASRTLIDVHLDGTVVEAERVLGVPGSPEVAAAVTSAVEQAAVGIALELVGLCDALLALTVQYANDRRQFDTPIGRFQAVKHKMADCFVAVQRARALACFAVAAISEDDPRRAMAVSMAKAAAGECQQLVCQHATQTFGGIGFTWEHDLHLHAKRAMTVSALFGGAADHRMAVARRLNLARA